MFFINEGAVNKEVGDVPSFAEEEYPDYAYMNKAGDKYEYGFGLSYNQGKAVGKPDHAGETGRPAHAGEIPLK